MTLFEKIYNLTKSVKINKLEVLSVICEHCNFKMTTARQYLSIYLISGVLDQDEFGYITMSPWITWAKKCKDKKVTT